MRDFVSSALRASSPAEPGKEQKDQIFIYMTGDADANTGDDRKDAEAVRHLRTLFDPLKRAYEEIFKPSFRLAHDLEPRAVWLQRLLGWNPAIANAVILCGQNLTETQEGPSSVKALRVAEFYKGCGAGQLTWVAVNKEHRRESLGLMMVLLGIRALRELASRNGETLAATVIEVNNPKCVNAEAYSDAKRPVYETFEKWGARFLPIEYRRPNVARGDTGKTTEFSLMVYPDAQTGFYPNKEQIRAALRGIYTNEGVADPEADPDFQQMSAALETCPDLTEKNERFVAKMASFEIWLQKRAHHERDNRHACVLDEPFGEWLKFFEAQKSGRTESPTRTFPPGRDSQTAAPEAQPV